MSTFLRLPPEVQYAIFEHVVRFTEPVPGETITRPPSFQTLKNLRRTCRQFRDVIDSLNVANLRQRYIASNTFQFDSPDSFRAITSEAMTSDQQRLRSIHSIRIDRYWEDARKYLVDPFEYGSDAEIPLAARYPGLERLTLCIGPRRWTAEYGSRRRYDGDHIVRNRRYAEIAQELLLGILPPLPVNIVVQLLMDPYEAWTDPDYTPGGRVFVVVEHRQTAVKQWEQIGCPEERVGPAA